LINGKRNDESMFMGTILENAFTMNTQDNTNVLKSLYQEYTKFQGNTTYYFIYDQLPPNIHNRNRT
jgi:hypothetical protein